MSEVWYTIVSKLQDVLKMKLDLDIHPKFTCKNPNENGVESRSRSLESISKRKRNRIDTSDLLKGIVLY